MWLAAEDGRPDTRTPSCRRGHVLDQPGFAARTDVAVAVALGSGPGNETLDMGRQVGVREAVERPDQQVV